MVDDTVADNKDVNKNIMYDNKETVPVNKETMDVHQSGNHLNVDVAEHRIKSLNKCMSELPYRHTGISLRQSTLHGVGVFADTALSSGDLLMVEIPLYTVADDTAIEDGWALYRMIMQNMLLNVIFSHRKLAFQILSPEKSTWCEKISANQFYTKNHFIMGICCSMLNHSCKYNCSVTAVKGLDCNYELRLHSTRAIRPG
jgi:hypothetical protein